jgi:hypothetical protein
MSYGHMEEAQRRGVGEPLQWIAVAIIERACLDWKNYGHLLEKPTIGGGYMADSFGMARSCGFAAPRDHCISYFNSETFREHCEIVGSSVDADAIIKHLGIPNTKPRLWAMQMSIDEYSSADVSWELV